MSPVLFLCIAGGALAMISPAFAQALRCEVTASPSSPAAMAEAFAPDEVEFATSVTIRCFDSGDAPAAAAQVCLSAQRETVSGSVELNGGAADIVYTVVANGEQIGSVPQQVWSGAVGTSGHDVAVDYTVEAGDFSGFPSGTYTATTSWTSHLGSLVCE